MTTANDLAVRRALELAGVKFIDENGGGPGLRLRKRQRAKTAKWIDGGPNNQYRCANGPALLHWFATSEALGRLQSALTASSTLGWLQDQTFLRKACHDRPVARSA
jgi:hypothetical protein